MDAISHAGKFAVPVTWGLAVSGALQNDTVNILLDPLLHLASSAFMCARPCSTYTPSGKTRCTKGASQSRSPHVRRICQSV